MEIGKTVEADLPAVLQVHRQAFGRDDEAGLVRALLADPSAEPSLSLLARKTGKTLGHVLFTTVSLDGEASLRGALLAPLAVRPEAQGKGVGRKLIEAGCRILRQDGVALVFVLGDPAYYRRFGFRPAAHLGFSPPYPLPEAHTEAWQVKVLGGESLPAGRPVRCAETLSNPELWQE